MCSSSPPLTAAASAYVIVTLLSCRSARLCVRPSRARLLRVKPHRVAPDDGCVFVAFVLRERDLHDYFVIHNENWNAVARVGTISRDLDGVAAVLDDVFHSRFLLSDPPGLCVRPSWALTSRACD